MSFISVDSSQAAPINTTTLPLGGQGASTAQSLDIWFANFQKYEVTLQEVTKTSAEAKFQGELATVEQWFKFLPEPERTASVYALLLHSDQDQIRFFISVLQQMIRPSVPSFSNESLDDNMKRKPSSRSMRPPSLNLPTPGSPTVLTPVTTKDSAFPSDQGRDEEPQTSPHFRDLSSKLKKSVDGHDKDAENAAVQLSGLGNGVMNPFHLNMLANSGLSTEAQLLAVQLVMSGLVQPAPSSTTRAHPKKPSHLGDPKNWRTPTSAKYPGSALRSGLRTSALKTASLKSAGLQSAGLDSPSSMATPKEEDFDPEMLNDIPAWLRSLRLHKYTACFDGLTWQEIVVLDDATLESKGVAALGARRRLLRTFEYARKRMGMESPSTATPTTSALSSVPSTMVEHKAPYTAAPPSRLSVSSPVFVPSAERVPKSADLTVSVTVPVDIS